MPQVLVTESSLEDIGDAIREKNGLETEYLPSEMGGAIRAIPVAPSDVMTKSVYDTNDNGVVDDSEGLEGHAASYFATAEALTALSEALSTLSGTVSGKMDKSVYDTNGNGIVDNAEAVNGHTVAKDVPAGAVFTDTVYDDTEITGRMDDAEGNIEEINTTLENKAGIDQSYSDLGAGYAAAIEPTKYTVNQEPYLFRKALGARLTSEKIVGGTVAWNQLVKNGDFANGNTGWSASNATFSVSGGEATVTTSAIYGQIGRNCNFITGHKYLASCDAKSSDSLLVGIGASLFASVRPYIQLSSSYTTIYTVAYAESTNETTINIAAKDGGDNKAFTVKNVMLTDLTLAFGTTIADHIYALEQAQAGAGVAFLRNNGFMTKDYYPYCANSLESVLTSAHVTTGKNLLPFFNEAKTNAGMTITPTSNGRYNWSGTATSANIVSYLFTPLLNLPDGVYRFVADNYTDTSGEHNITLYYRPKGDSTLQTLGIGQTIDVSVNEISAIVFFTNVNKTVSLQDIGLMLVSVDATGYTFEPYESHTYPLSPVSLRGIMTLEDGKLKNDGDEYLPDGTVKRNCAERDYQEGDASDGSTMITNGIKTVYKLTTPTTETTDPYQSEQTCSEYGTEAFIDERDVPIPVGHVTKYWPDLVAKIEGLPDVTAIAPVENGSTASQAYTAGQYFFRNGEFCKAKTNIASGATFTLNTNYETTTIAAELYVALNS